MVKFDVYKIGENIYFLNFETRRDVTSTLLRFQECIDTHDFRGKIFTLTEYKKWYIAHRGKGKFTYYEDWGGFNFPDSVLKPFYAGKFDPLSAKEKKVLETFRNVRGKFYVIATFKRKGLGTLKHEVGHALYYVNKKYRGEVDAVLSKIKVPEMERRILLKGYAPEVLKDEVHAYLISSVRELYIKPKYKEEQRMIRKIFNRYYPELIKSMKKKD